MTYINKVILPKVKKKEELKKCIGCNDFRTSNRGLYCIKCKIQRTNESNKRYKTKKRVNLLKKVINSFTKHDLSVANEDTFLNEDDRIDFENKWNKK